MNKDLRRIRGTLEEIEDEYWKEAQDEWKPKWYRLDKTKRVNIERKLYLNKEKITEALKEMQEIQEEVKYPWMNNLIRPIINEANEVLFKK